MVRKIVPGVLEKFGPEASSFRRLIRSIEDAFDERGFDQLMPDLLAYEDIFKRNLEFLGERFMDNLVHVNLNGESGVVVLPEGTMRTYDFISRNNLDKARIFYSQSFVRNEPPEEVAEGKTRNFWQIGCEIFGYDLLDSSIDAMTTAYDVMASSGLPDARIRFTDKRLLKGLTERFNESERTKIMRCVEGSNDDADQFYETYLREEGSREDIAKDISNFLRLNKKDLSIRDLKDLSDNPTYLEGIHYISSILNGLPARVKTKLLPFMAKSWDACDKLLFDARVSDYDSALAGGGNLVYRNYMPDVSKSGMGVGVTRIFEVQKNRKI
jgi:histidyl-tRNA synthetase